MTPVIGITTYEDQASWRNWSARARMLPWGYVDAVRRSGGRPVLLPPGGSDDEAAATVAGLDGLVVSGGPDIDPARYGASRQPETHPPAPLRGRGGRAARSRRLGSARLSSGAFPVSCWGFSGILSRAATPACSPRWPPRPPSGRPRGRRHLRPWPSLSAKVLH